MRYLFICLFLLIASVCVSQPYHFRVKNVDQSEFPLIHGSFSFYDNDGNLLDIDTSKLRIFDQSGKRRYLQSYGTCPKRVDDSVAIMLTLDVSGSMRGQIDTTYMIENAFQSLEKFTNIIQPKTLISYQTFDDRLMYNLQFTDDVSFIRQNIRSTPLGWNNDFSLQLYSALDSLRKVNVDRKACILFTDGIWWAIPEVDITNFITTCDTNNIQLYLVLFSHSGTNWSFTQQIQQVIISSGGKVYNEVIDDSSIIDFLADINNELYYDTNGCQFTIIANECLQQETFYFHMPIYNLYDTVTIINTRYDSIRMSKVIVETDSLLSYRPCLTDTLQIKLYDKCGNKLKIGNISNNRFLLIDDTLVYNPISYHPIDSVKITVENFDTTIYFSVKDITGDTVFAILGDTLRDQITIDRVIDYCNVDSVIIPVQQLTCVDLIFTGISAIKDSNTGLYFIILPVLPSDQQYNSTTHQFTINGKQVTVTINVRTRRDGELIYPHTILSSYDLCKPDSVVLVKIINPNCWQQSFDFGGKNYSLQPYDSVTIPLTYSFNVIGIFSDTAQLIYSIFDSVITDGIIISTNVYSSQEDSLIANTYTITDTLADKCDESTQRIQLFNISCGNNPVKIDTILWNNNHLIVKQASNDSLLFVYSPTLTQQDSSIVLIVYNNYKDTVTITHRILFVQQDTVIVKLNSAIESYTLTDWKVNIYFDDSIISDSIRIRLLLTNEGLSFDFFTYDWNIITSIDTIVNTDHSLDIVLHFDRHEFRLNEILLTLHGKSYITQYDTTLLVIDDVQSFADLQCYDSVLVKGNNSLFSIDSCGTGILRSVLRKNSFTISDNPAKGHFTIITGTGGQFIMYDLLGNAVFTGVTNKQYSTNQLSQQQYFIGVNGIIGKQLFIIQR